MDVVCRGGHQVAGFGVGGSAPSPPPTVAIASVMTGAAAGLLAYVLRAPVWGAILVGAGSAVVAKVAIDRA